MQKYKLEIMLAVVNEGEADLVQKVLENNGIEHSFVCMAKGTANSQIENLFSFGIMEKEIVSFIVSSSESKVLFKKLYEELFKNDEHKGLLLTMPLNAISSDLFQNLGF